MKLLNDQTAEHQAELLNLSLKAVVFLDSLNITKSIPIHGKDSKLKFSNYTPASLLFNLDKMFENLIGNKIVYFLEEKKVLRHKQFGFQKDLSTAHAIIYCRKKLNFLKFQVFEIIGLHPT